MFSLRALLVWQARHGVCKVKMISDFGKLNRELTQVQLLLQTSHKLFEEILVEVTCRRRSHDALAGLEISGRFITFAHREHEIAKIISRLENLTAMPLRKAN